MQTPNCFYAHQKFLAMIKTCKHHPYGSNAIVEKDIKLRQECIEEIFKLFQKECLEEEYVNKESARWFKVI